MPHLVGPAIPAEQGSNTCLSVDPLCRRKTSCVFSPLLVAGAAAQHIHPSKCSVSVLEGGIPREERSNR